MSSQIQFDKNTIMEKILILSGDVRISPNDQFLARQFLDQFLVNYFSYFSFRKPETVFIYYMNFIQMAMRNLNYVFQI
ncbi:MAG: hypothetical protein MJ252_18265 [archaeon]|nr:hypothetical protein [archaeon]